MTNPAHRFQDNTSRFYLTNEDARPVRAALRCCKEPPERPAFVGGSGMVLLESMISLADSTRASFVDISSAQIRLFQELRSALGDVDRAEELRVWFERSVYPRLAAHYEKRGLHFTLPKVIVALRELFGISFFFDNKAFFRARKASRRVDVYTDDIVNYLNGTAQRHDFIYLSNVADYMSETRIRALFEACAGHRAAVYMLATTACEEYEALPSIWSHFEYEVHPDTHNVNASNRGLGAKGLQRGWNRPGHVFLLVPRSALCSG